jgi:hypothetical protein
MINVDMNIVEFLPRGGKVYDSYSTGYSAPIEDTSLGGTNDLKNIKFSQENGQEVVTYERLKPRKLKPSIKVMISRIFCTVTQLTRTLARIISLIILATLSKATALNTILIQIHSRTQTIIPITTMSRRTWTWTSCTTS